MRKIVTLCLVSLPLLVGLAEGPIPPAVTEGGISVYFSPDGGCTDAIAAEIASAKSTLDIQAYNFTSTEIAAAVAKAHERDVKVRVVLDKSNRTGKYSGATYLANHGVPVWIDAKHAIAHNKVMIIDSNTVITGSFNFTKAAEERNAENLLIIRDKQKIVAAYTRNFQEHLRHSEPYKKP